MISESDRHNPASSVLSAGPRCADRFHQKNRQDRQGQV